MTDNNNGIGSLTGEKYLFENLNEEARANSLGNPITQLFGKKVRLTASGAWRGVAVEDIDSLDSPHSRDTDCVPITWKSNIAKISKMSTLSSRISSSSSWTKQLPSFRRRGTEGCCSSRNGIHAPSSERERGKGVRTIDAWIDGRILEMDLR